MKFNKKNKVEETEKVILMGNEGCTNNACPGTNVGTCTSNNSTAGCGC